MNQICKRVTFSAIEPKTIELPYKTAAEALEALHADAKKIRDRTGVTIIRKRDLTLSFAIIRKFVAANPGTSVQEISSNLNINIKMCFDDVNRMVDAGMITRKIEKRAETHRFANHYYPATAPIRDRQSKVVRVKQDPILDYILANPGRDPDEVAEATGCARRTAVKKLRDLEKAAMTGGRDE